MATKQQLENLRKGREALAKKRASGSIKKRKKTVKKNPVKSVRKSPEFFLIKVTLQNKKIGYVINGKLDTSISEAQKFTLTNAEKTASAFFNKYKKHLKTVEVITAPKR